MVGRGRGRVVGRVVHGSIDSSHPPSFGGHINEDAYTRPVPGDLVETPLSESSKSFVPSSCVVDAEAQLHEFCIKYFVAGMG